MKTLLSLLTFLIAPSFCLAAEIYFYLPDNIPLVTNDPTQPGQLNLVSDPPNMPLVNKCYSWGLGNMMKDIDTGSFGWATGFYPPSPNQIQSLSTDSGFQSYGSEQGIYIATPGRSREGVVGFQCGKYYGTSGAFFPWSYSSNAILRHGVTFKMPQAWHSNAGYRKYQTVMYLRVSERGVIWRSSSETSKGFWLQVVIVDGRGPGILPNGYVVEPDVFTSHYYIDILKSTQATLITSNNVDMQTLPWSDYRYFDYTINRNQISQIVQLVNAKLAADGRLNDRLTTNPNDLMIFALGTNPEVHVLGAEQAVVGVGIKNQYVRVEY